MAHSNRHGHRRTVTGNDMQSAQRRADTLQHIVTHNGTLKQAWTPTHSYRQRYAVRTTTHRHTAMDDCTLPYTLALSVHRHRRQHSRTRTHTCLGQHTHTNRHHQAHQHAPFRRMLALRLYFSLFTCLVVWLFDFLVADDLGMRILHSTQVNSMYTSCAWLPARTDAIVTGQDNKAVVSSRYQNRRLVCTHVSHKQALM